jgi:hypothetical protein
MDKISNGENDTVVFLSEGAPCPNLIGPLLGFFLAVFFPQARRCRFQFHGGTPHERYPSSGSDHNPVTDLRFQFIGTGRQ